MASKIRFWVPRFADGVSMGTVIAVNRQGAHPMEIIAEPVRAKNLVGDHRTVILRVRLKDTDVEGQMFYRPGDVVFVQNSDR